MVAARVGGVPSSPRPGPVALRAKRAPSRRQAAPRTLPTGQPLSDYQLTEIADNLKGVTPQSTTLSITPEDWYFVK
jgi:hypothetical protein